MRKKSAGLLSLVVAAGLGTTLGMPAITASAAPQVSKAATAGDVSQPDQVQSDALPNPADEKKQALREQAISDLLNGKGTVKQRGASKVVKVGTTKTPATADKNGDRVAAASSEDQYVELGREKTDKIFVILAEFGNEATTPTAYGDQDTAPAARARPPSRPAAQHRSPSRTAPWTTPRSGRRTTTVSTSRTCTSARATRGPAASESRQAVLRAAVVGPLQRRRLGHRLGQGQVQRGPLRPQQRLPCAGNVCSNTWDLVKRRHRQLGRRPEGRRPDRRPDQGGCSPPTTSGTATTSTTTATSTSPTATSTTSRSSTRVATRPTATRSRARTPSGRTAGTPTRAAGTARRATRTAAPRSATPESGSATTPSSPRTAESSVFAHEYSHDLGMPDLYDTAGRPTRTA